MMAETTKKEKKLRSSLTASIVMMIVSFAMLVTSTFSWFTDTSSSGINRIVSGTLDIEADYYNGNDWVSLENASTLFQKNDWEPGVTDVVYLRIHNNGNLALKYKVSVQTIKEQPGTNVYGDEFNISRYLRFAAVENVNGEANPFETRDAALVAVNEGNTLDSVRTINDISSDVVLLPGEESFLALIVNMPSGTGNAANHLTGTDAPKITLGIEILATQATAEYDSFGNEYDESAEYPESQISPQL